MMDSRMLARVIILSGSRTEHGQERAADRATEEAIRLAWVSACTQGKLYLVAGLVSIWDDGYDWSPVLSVLLYCCCTSRSASTRNC